LRHVLYLHLLVIPQAECYCFLSILYNSGQLERGKIKGCKLLCLLKLCQTGVTQRPMQCVHSPGSWVVKYKHIFNKATIYVVRKTITPLRSLRHVIICISIEKTLVPFPTYATIIPDTSCPVRVQHAACLSIEACCPGQGSRVLSVLIEGSWLSQHHLQCGSGRRCRIASCWYTTLRQDIASAVGVINRRPSSLRL